MIKMNSTSFVWGDMYIFEDVYDYNSKVKQKHKNKISDPQARFLKSIVLTLTMNQLNAKILLDISAEVLVISDSFFFFFSAAWNAWVLKVAWSRLAACLTSGMSDRTHPQVPCSLIYFSLLLLVNGNHDKVYISRHIHMPRPINILWWKMVQWLHSSWKWA